LLVNIPGAGCGCGWWRQCCGRKRRGGLQQADQELL
jgi:hypothetical protein